MPINLTVDAIREAKFRGPIRFADGRNGMAQRDFESVDEPRLGYAWRRENRKDKGRQFYTVDGSEVASIEEAIAKLMEPPAHDSLREIEKRYFEERKDWPVTEGHMRVPDAARNFADAGPFATLAAWYGRVENAYHQGINKWNDSERGAGREFVHWPYNAKTSLFETKRGLLLFERDAASDTGLKCALGTKCRSCPILTTIKDQMDAAKLGPFSRDYDETDVNAVKVWTCIAHILQTRPNEFFDGGFFSTKEDREDRSFF